MKRRASIRIYLNWLRFLAGWAVVMVASASLAAWPDVPPVFRWQPQPGPAALPPGQTIPVLPDLTPTIPQEPDPKKPKPEKLTPQSRLSLVRYIHGEFARAVVPVPSVKKGYRIKVKGPADEQTMRMAAQGGSAANPGDTVQITRMEFRDKEILLDINGGSKKRRSWRDRIQISAGGNIPTVRTTQTNADAPSGSARGGATLILDFGGPVPEMTADEFKQILLPYLDFAKQRSAAVQWVETLPPEYQAAIKEKRALVGMDREMVVAALGRPEQRVRERDADGNETEDWIYGHPPAKTIFVKFMGDKVVAVREFPR